MSMRTTDILGYLTLFAILAGIWFLFSEDPSKHQGGRGEVYLKDFTRTVPTITSIHMEKEGKALTLVKKDALWFVDHKPHSQTIIPPVDTDRVHGIFQALASVTRVQPMAIRQQNFADLHLLDRALTVTFKDQNNHILLSFKVGKHRAVNNKSRSYAYQDTDTRAWMVADLPTFSLKAEDWQK